MLLFCGSVLRVLGRRLCISHLSGRIAFGFSRGTFPILSRDASFQEAIRNAEETDPVFEKNDV